MNIRISTDKTADKAFSEYKENTHPAVGKMLDDAANIVRSNAVRGIQRGTKTGRIYGKHQASAPGQYPASDHGALAGSIRIEKLTDARDVGSDKKYGKFLEEGTKNIKARPYLSPSLEAAEADIESIIDNTLKRLFNE